ncbi:MAG: efflux RND transporter periplasmic adaptor subunit [Marinilabiliales bacterium]|nr:efflux RND transporter periplasmic adaptor subunit [Marinilabiliales bacterium]
MNGLKIFIAFAMMAGMSSCHNGHDPVESKQPDLVITHQQFEAAGMQLGSMEQLNFDRIVKCNGTVMTLPNGRAEVGAPVAGIVKSIRCNNGQSIATHQPLLEISGTEIIELQRDLAQSAATYKRLKLEYERVRSLHQEKVASEKEYILAESEFQSALAGYNSLRLKIDAVGLAAEEIEKGHFYPSYLIKAPLKGKISELDIHPGSYVNPQTHLLSITDPSLFQLRLAVFPADVPLLQQGQVVRFRGVNGVWTGEAKMVSVGITLDETSKAIPCFAAISDRTLLHAVANAFVEAEIITGRDSVLAVPSESVSKTEAGAVLLELFKWEEDKFHFRKVDVKTRRQQNGRTEIIGTRIQGKIIAKGAYNLSV